MEDEPNPSKPDQPALFDLTQETSIHAIELFPAVWSAVEALAAQDADLRNNALDRLLALGAPRVSPLVAYLLATRLTDPDIRLRARVVSILGEVLSKDEAGNAAPEAVKKHLTTYLAQMRTRSIFAILEVAIHDRSLENAIASLFNACNYAGMHMAGILSDRKFPLPVRLQAAHYIGLVGFLDAIPIMERLESRLLSKVGGQQAMPFAPPTGPDESDLLPIVQFTLNVLRSR
jgi:hypothetical protein